MVKTIILILWMFGPCIHSSVYEFESGYIQLKSEFYINLSKISLLSFSQFLTCNPSKNLHGFRRMAFDLRLSRARTGVVVMRQDSNY